VSRLDRSLIANLDVFSGLAAADLDHIVDAARPVRIEKGASLFEQDQEADRFFVLLDGRVRVLKTTPDGQQVTVRYIMPGELMGIAHALGRATYPATALAVLDCVALGWQSRLWAEFASAYPAFAMNTNRTIGSRLSDAHTQIVDMATRQVEQRIAHCLLRLVKQSGRKTGEGILIDFPISRQDIAEMTGTTLHTVSRALAAWEAKGLVVSKRQQVTVANPHELLLIADGLSK